MIQQIETFLFDNPTFGTRLFETLFLLLLLLLIRRIVMWRVTKGLDDHSKIYTWRKVTEYAVLFLALITIIALWFDGFSNASTYLGLLSAGIAIALQDPLVNIIGWLFILMRHPFEVGDRIQIEQTVGDVIDIELFKFSLLEVGNWVDAEQSTGRIIHVPNRMVFNHLVANYTSGIPYIWNEIPITITFESNWKLAKKLLQEITERHALYPTPDEELEIKRAAKKNNVRYPKLTPVVYTKVSNSGVVLTLRYLCRPRRRRNSEQAIWEEVLQLFAEQKELDFAYVTQRVFYHPIEGKTLLVDHSEVSQPRSHLSNE